MDNSRTLILIRGLPGSGKSTLAEKIQHAHDSWNDVPSAWFEADHYFVDKEGNYNWDGNKIADAHAWCHDRVNDSMINGIPLIIVSNTFVLKKHMEGYLYLAEEYDYKVQTIICKGDFGSVHNVPQHTIDRMKQQWED